VILAWNEILIRLSLAALFGALIGLERERKDWAAGMRTHMMVCVGSALIMIVSAYGFGEVLGKDHVVLDPSRVAAQVISGIGFIGAGTIIFLKFGTIRGLTTASGLWTVAAIGLASGGGMYFAASATTLLALIILWALQPLERMYSKRFRQKTLRIVITQKKDVNELLAQIWQNNEVENFDITQDGNDSIIQFKFEKYDKEKIKELIDKMQQTETIKEINWYA